MSSKLDHLKRLKHQGERTEHHTLEQIDDGHDRHHNHVDFLDNPALFLRVYLLEYDSRTILRFSGFVCDRSSFGLRNALNMGFLGV